MGCRKDRPADIPCAMLLATLRLGLLGARDAEKRRGIEFEAFVIDWLTAAGASPVGTLGEPVQCAFDSLELGLASAGEFLGHGLALHVIHAGQAAQPGLVKLDGLCAFGRRFPFLKELRLQFTQARFNGVRR